MLGVSDATLGVAWPAIRDSFNRSIDSMSVLLVASAIGYLVTAIPMGRLLLRFGAVSILIASGCAAAIAAGAYASAPFWWVLPAAALLLGAASGGVDAAVNTTIAHSASSRLVNLVHGGYGVGTVLGPIVVTIAIVFWHSWRTSYVILIGLELFLVFGWLRTRSGWDRRWQTDARISSPESDSASIDSPTQRDTTLVVIGLIVFFLYTGAELTTGQWAASFLRGPIRLGATAAGIVVAAYWGAFALVRFAMASARRQNPTVAVIRIGELVALGGACLVWWQPIDWIAVVGILLMGCGFAPIFPALVKSTISRLGIDRTQHAIGWQLAAAGAGGLSLSAVVGILLQSFGLRSFGLILAVLAAALILASAGLDLGARRRRLEKELLREGGSREATT